MWSVSRILTHNTCFPWGPFKVVIRSVRPGSSSSSSISRRSTAEYAIVVESSLGIGSCRNGKKN
jgi:hypothetical protein